MKKLLLIFPIIICLLSLDSFAGAQRKTAQPKTVRDFFMLLPPEYFQAGSCGDPKTNAAQCRRDTENYLKRYLDVEDTANGYMRGGGEAGQGGFEMAMFKRPDGTYVVALYGFGEMWDDFYFLEYKNGRWSDIGKKTVPDYGKKRWYELPRTGTTIKVYEKIDLEPDSDITFGEAGKKLYDLKWKDGKFSIKK